MTVSGILAVLFCPFNFFICFHRYELSLFSAIDLEKKSFLEERTKEDV